MDNQEQTKYCAVLFADVVDSARLYDQLGDDVAHKVIGEGITLLKSVVIENHGVVIKTIGDEVMAAFDNVNQGVLAAVFMLSAIKAKDEAEGGAWGEFQIKAGIHCGTVIEKENDLFGNVVNMAARLVGQAKDSQILISRDVVDKVGAAFETRLIDTTNLKGIKEKVELFEVLVDDGQISSTTVIDDDAFDEFHTQKEIGGTELELKFGETLIKVNADKDRVKMGRKEGADIKIDADGVSRLHATIHFKNDQFLFSDKSTNGSFIVNAAGEKSHVRRGDIVLKGVGTISLGQPLEGDSKLAIHYKVN